MGRSLRSRAFVLGAASFALGFLAGGPTVAGGEGDGDGAGAPAGAGGCPEGTRAYLAAGAWKGTFKLVYEPIVPGMPPGMRATVTWSGDLSFQVDRPELSDPPPPPKPSTRRRPLAPPLAEGEKPPVTIHPDRAAPGQFANDDEQRAAILAWYAEQARADEAAAQERARLYGTQITPSGGRVDRPQLRGGLKGRVAMSIGGVPMAGASGRASGRSDDEVRCELSATEEDPERGIRRIEVRGDPRAIGFTYEVEARGPGGRGAGSGSTPGASGDGKTLVTWLEIDELRCGVVSGHLDATAIRELTRKGLPGYDMRVIENTWSATREVRDEAFERRVEDLASQPLPARLSWGYLDEFTARAAELRASVGKPTDYHRCVLKALEGQFVRISRAMIKELGKAFPDGELKPSCEVLRQAMASIYRIQRTLELYGADGCPEVAEAWANVEKQVQRTVKFVLQDRPDFVRLACYRGLYGAGLLGDVAEPYMEALKKAEFAARPK